MRILYTTLLFFNWLLPVVGQNTWNPVSDFTNNRMYAVAFSIGNTGYVGLGKQLGSNTYFNDLWAYDTTSNSWSARTSLPAAARSQSAVFVINGKAYVIGGETNTGTELDEVWEYDAANDNWTQKTDFPGGVRRSGFSFAIGNYGYFGSGITSAIPTDDCWEYNPVSDTWNVKASFPSGLNHSAYASFAIDQKGYVVGGLMFNSSSITLNETWEFDPPANSWTQKSNYPHPVGQPTAFVIDGKGYVVCGNSTSPTLFYNDLNQFDPVADTWINKTAFPGAARSGLSAFSIGNRAYAGSGFSANQTMYDDWYRYTCDDTTVTFISSNHIIDPITAYPNPVVSQLNLGNNGEGLVSIINAQGQLVYTFFTDAKNYLMDLSFLANGTYFLCFDNRFIKIIKQ